MQLLMARVLFSHNTAPPMNAAEMVEEFIQLIITVSINNTKFLRNRAITAYGGAIVLLLNSTSTIESCAFVNNSAEYGGAIDTYETHHNH